jgi:hypothetical protein
MPGTQVGKNINDSIQQYLKTIYYKVNHAGSYAGVERLYRAVREEKKHNITRKTIKKFIQSQPVYTRHRQIIRKFSRVKHIAPKIDYIWQADVAFMPRDDAQFNNDTYHFLLVIDTFSKFVWTFPLRHKTAENVIRSLKEIFEKSERKCKLLQFDRGSEFLNKKMRVFADKYHFKATYTSNETKASQAERALKTIKRSLYMIKEQNQTKVWIKYLAEATASYNASYHSAIKMSPNQVDVHHQARLFHLKHGKPLVKGSRRWRLNIDSLVRLSIEKTSYIRAYVTTFSDEVYRIYERLLDQGMCICACVRVYMCGCVWVCA